VQHLNCVLVLYFCGKTCSDAIFGFRFTQRNMLVAHINRQDLLRSSVAAFAKIPDSVIERNIAIV
jgi:hypothetical protein